MDLKQLEYIIAIAEEQSIAKAAQKLFMTQSGLNQQLLKLERELGLPLFHRIKHGMVPTYAGTIYLETARKMLMMKQETYRLLQDIADMKKGEIAIAYTPEQGSRMFSHIYPIFHRMYPDITFKIYEARVKQGEQLLLRGSVNMVFGVPKSHPLAALAGERSWEAFPPIDFHLLRDEPVILVSKETRLRDMVDTLYEAAGVKPRILFESASSITAFNMVKSQVAPAFFPQSYVTPTAPIAYFSVGNRMRWMRSALTRKDAYISKAEQDFLKLAKDYVQCQQGCEG